MTVALKDVILFENEEWTVTESGLEHRHTEYFIPRDEIGIRRADGLWSWPLHMAEKSWCAVPAFMEAFSCAVGAYGMPADTDLAQSFHIARREIATCGSPVPAEQDVSLRSRIQLPISPLSAPSERSDSGLGQSGVPFEWSRQREPVAGHAFPLTARARLSHPDLVRAARWRASRRIRRAGTRIVRLLRAAWIAV
jgi:hypothetical protein